MRDLKFPKHLTMFRRALKGVNNAGDPLIGLQVSIEVEADAYLLYQSYRNAMKDFRKFETQKAKIVEMFRTRYF